VEKTCNIYHGWLWCDVVVCMGGCAFRNDVRVY
jgi:hypothetical protein